MSLWTHFEIKCTDKFTKTKKTKKKKMVDKPRAALQQNEELAETVRTFPCLYDKLAKEYKDKNVVQNA